MAKPINERPIEYGFLFRHLLATWPRKVLDVGSGLSSLPQLLSICGYDVTATDRYHSRLNRHFEVIADNIANTQLTGPFDFISCLSVLEHIQEYDDAVGCMLRLLVAGGHLVLTFPYNEDKFVSDVYKRPGAGYGQDVSNICNIYCRENLDAWTEMFGAQIIEQEYWRVFNGALWTMGGRLEPAVRVGSAELHHLTCLLMQRGG